MDKRDIAADYKAERERLKKASTKTRKPSKKATAPERKDAPSAPENTAEPKPEHKG